MPELLLLPLYCLLGVIFVLSLHWLLTSFITAPLQLYESIVARIEAWHETSS